MSPILDWLWDWSSAPIVLQSTKQTFETSVTDKLGSDQGSQSLYFVCAWSEKKMDFDPDAAYTSVHLKLNKMSIVYASDETIALLQQLGHEFQSDEYKKSIWRIQKTEMRRCFMSNTTSQIAQQYRCSKVILWLFTSLQSCCIKHVKTCIWNECKWVE